MPNETADFQSKGLLVKFNYEREGLRANAIQPLAFTEVLQSYNARRDISVTLSYAADAQIFKVAIAGGAETLTDYFAAKGDIPAAGIATFNDLDIPDMVKTSHIIMALATELDRKKGGAFTSPTDTLILNVLLNPRALTIQDAVEKTGMDSSRFYTLIQGYSDGKLTEEDAAALAKLCDNPHAVHMLLNKPPRPAICPRQPECTPGS